MSTPFSVIVINAESKHIQCHQETAVDGKSAFEKLKKSLKEPVELIVAVSNIKIEESLMDWHTGTILDQAEVHWNKTPLISFPVENLPPVKSLLGEVPSRKFQGEIILQASTILTPLLANYSFAKEYFADGVHVDITLLTKEELAEFKVLVETQKELIHSFNKASFANNNDGFTVNAPPANIQDVQDEREKAVLDWNQSKDFVRMEELRAKATVGITPALSVEKTLNIFDGCNPDAIAALVVDNLDTQLCFADYTNSDITLLTAEERAELKILVKKHTKLCSDYEEAYQACCASPEPSNTLNDFQQMRQHALNDWSLSENFVRMGELRAKALV